MTAVRCRLFLVAVLVGVVLAGLFGVMNRMQMMTVRHVGMVAGLFMIPGFVLAGSFKMMLRRVFVVLGGFAMMVRSFF